MTQLRIVTVILLSYLGVAAAGYLSLHEKSLTASLVGLLVAVPIRLLNVAYLPTWWRVKMDPLFFAVICVVAALSKGMGTGSESGDRVSRVVISILAIGFIMFTFVYDAAVLRRSMSAQKPT